MNAQALVSYLSVLAQNNNRPWFEANRPEYERLRAEFSDLVAEVIFGIGEFDPLISGVRPQECMFRIHRDVRFSKDKTPYKTQFSAAISGGGRNSGQPIYYVHINDLGELFMAAGLYMPDPERLQRVRRFIVNRPERLARLLADPEFARAYGTFERYAELKRPPQGFAADAPYPDLLRLKSHTVSHTQPVAAVGEEGLGPAIIAVFHTMAPAVAWLREALGAD